MNAKIMEGLAGAGTNMKLINTPMRVFRDARRRGDLAVMERALGYAGDFAEKSQEYMAEADEGMEEDAKQAREKMKAEQEKAIQKRKEEHEKFEEQMEEHKTEAETDTVEISEEGKVLLQEQTGSRKEGLVSVKTDTVKEPVIYTGTGEAVSTVTEGGISVSV